MFYALDIGTEYLPDAADVPILVEFKNVNVKLCIGKALKSPSFQTQQ